MGKSKKPKVYDYLYSLDYAFLNGPINSLNKIWIKDVEVPGSSAAGLTRTDLVISEPDLFGGDTKEGGVEGVIEVYLGGPNQRSSAELAARMGGLPDSVPGYPKQMHLFFRGMLNTGFKWITNNPYIPSLMIHTTSLPSTLGLPHHVVPPIGVNFGEDYDGSEWIPTTSEALDSFIAVGLPDPGGLTYTIDLVTGAVAGATVPGSAGSGGLLGWINSQVDDFIGNPDDITATQNIPFDPDGLDQCGVKYTISASASFVYTRPTSWAGRPARGVVRAIITGTIVTPSGTSTVIRTVASPIGLGGVSFSGSGSFPAGVRNIQVKFEVPAMMAIYSRGTLTGSNFEVTGGCGGGGGGGGGGGSGSGTFNPTLMPNANPAHIIHYIIQNPAFGYRDGTCGLVDEESMRACAETLFNENFGLAMLWNRQAPIDSFVQDVLDHIKAALYISPRLGRWKMRLLRNDYDALTLREINPTNAVLKNPKRPRWNDTINEITVSFTDPANEADATVTAQQIANVEIQGGTISETRNYHGIRDRKLAQRVANRDVIEASTPLFAATVWGDRSFWDIEPGECCTLVWPDENIGSMVVRVMGVDYGSIGDRYVKMDVVQDIFSVDTATPSEPQEAPIDDDKKVPVDISGAAFIELPMPEILKNGYSFDDADRYPDTLTAILASSDMTKIIDIRAWSEIVNSDGEVGVGLSAVITPTKYTFTAFPLIAEATSNIPRAIVDSVGGGFAKPGRILMVGNEQSVCELILLARFNETTQEWVGRRGIYDSIPRDWPINSVVWLFPDSDTVLDETVRVAGEVTNYWLQPKTRGGRLARRKMVKRSHVVSARSYLPHRPANCQIDANGFADTVYDVMPYPSSVTATWSNRNRLLEDGIIPKWGDPNVTPEAGQTTVLRVTDAFGVLITEIAGLTGTSYVIPSSAFGAGLNYVEFWSERDGLMSLQSARRKVVIGQSGWGFDWGFNWNG